LYLEFAIFRSPTSAYNYVHALSVTDRTLKETGKKNGTSGRRAGGNSFFEPSQAFRTHRGNVPNAALPGNDDDVNGPMRKTRAETDRKRRRRHRTIRDRYPEAHTTR
jgi:hypothetical protein